MCTRTAGTEELLPDDTHGIVLPGQPQDATVETIRAGLQTLLDDPARADKAHNDCPERGGKRMIFGKAGVFSRETEQDERREHTDGRQHAIHGNRHPERMKRR